jgi:hypothetical protein
LSHGLIRIVASAILSLAIAGLAALSAQASTFTVINTNDTGAVRCARRSVDANAHPGFDEVKFNIPGLGGVRTITLASSLPWITDPITIDGYSQPGASPNTLANGDDATLLIEINGANALGGNGLVITGGSSNVQGLIINRFSGTNPDACAVLIMKQGRQCNQWKLHRDQRGHQRPTTQHVRRSHPGFAE